MTNITRKILLIVAIFLLPAINELATPPVQAELISPLPKGVSGYVQVTTTPETPVKAPTILYLGHISYYSHNGCIGCSKGQIMGNGEPYDEIDLTLAVPCEDVMTPAKVKHGTKVIVTNETNGKQEVATITDCGGFSKYGRVADLLVALMQKLEAKTDKSIIRIEKILE